MTTPLNVLILEDQPADVELTLYALQKAGFEPNAHRVETESGYVNALNEDLDIILADFTLPQFSALHALTLLQEKNLDIPFIVVSGTISEDVAVQCMKLGAADYLLKDRLTRLGPAVAHALNQKSLRDEKRKADRQLRLLSSAVEQSSEGIAVTDLDGNLLFVNNALAEMHGYEQQELVGKNLAIFHTEDQIPALETANNRIFNTGEFNGEIWHTTRNRVVFPGLEHNTILRDEKGNPIGVIRTLRDITERKLSEMALEEERATLARRVEERTVELRQANKELERASRLKDEFLAAMSHELRTPLNAILGMSEALLEEVYGDLTERQRRSLERIEESGRHLLALINDILDISKIEAGKLSLDVARFPVRGVCESSLRLITQIAHKKQITVNFEMDDTILTMMGDQRRVKQILVNLLSNAVKFTPEKGQVGLRVTGDMDKNHIQFTIWDTGIGISEEDKQRLFQPFVQLDSSLSRHHAGTGLGLALVRRLADMHEGTVSLESGVGEGSTFYVHLPWHPKEERATISSDDSHDSGILYGAMEKQGSTARILLVEDNDHNIATISEYLEIKGYDVILARNGEQAIERTKRDKPDLILMDVQMPGMDGLEATRRIRADEAIPHIPIITVTAMAMRGDRERCLAAGADDYIGKPIRLKTLMKAIASLLGAGQKS